LTASHVIRDEQSGDYFSAITVTLPSGAEYARPALPLSLENVGQDFALLKIDGKMPLPFLELGSTTDVSPGAEATIIGYPFSALTVQDRNVFTKFCLSASFAATDSVTVPVRGMTHTRTGVVPIQRDVKVDVIYFQGPSVKGISGSPIISRDTGRVVGIVSLKLTGIGQALMELKRQTAEGMGGGIGISGLEPGKAINQILTVMDDQLANGLGAAAGVDDPKYALKQAERIYKK
jgi:hypothetical protein